MTRSTTTEVDDEPPISVLPDDPARPARWSDIFQISHLLRTSAPHCVPMTPREVLGHIDEFDVISLDGQSVLGTAALRDLRDGRVELRGLAVRPNARGLGLGRHLVRRAIRRARDRGLELVCVTTKPAFFERLGFQRIPLESVPPKAGRTSDAVDGRTALAFEHEETTIRTRRASGAAE